MAQEGCGIAPAAMIDFRHNLAPIYLQLVTIFRRFILTGQWPVGERIPTVDDLAARFGIARATVRHALDLIEREGLVSRRRRHGTFVTARPVPMPRYLIPTDWRSLVRSKDGMTITCLARPADTGPPARQEADWGRLAPSYRQYTKLYSRDGQPLLFEVSHVEVGLARRIGDERLRRQGTLRLIDADAALKIGRADQTVLVGAADAEIAQALRVPPHAPAAVARYAVQRRDGVLTCSIEEIYRGDVAVVTERLTV